ncbi:MAG: S1C family serine protease [Halodesulfurarchaeum sp.]
MPRDTFTRRQFLELGGVGLLTGLAGCSSPEAGSESTTTAPPTTAGPDTDDRSNYTEVYRDTIPSVVMVRTERSQGTGFVYDRSHVITNAHVIGTATSAQLRFNDGSWAVAEVRGVDRHSDLAVLTPDSLPEPATPLPSSDEPPVVGTEVLAIGNPYNLDGTVTNGIISGTDRLIEAPSGYLIPDAIQTDAAVNPGNSGGPLMNLESEVVGVVNSKQGDNIGFGISAALTWQVVPKLIETGEYEHAYLGAALQNVTPTDARANELDVPRGLIVVQTVEGGPVDGVLQESRVGIVDGERVPVGGDIILAVDGKTMESFEDLASYLALHTRPGDSIALRLLRDGSERTVEVTLGTRPEGSRSPLQ